MSSRRRSLAQRIKDHIGFSVVAILAIFIVLRLFGVRSTASGIFFSICITLALNVGLSYYTDYRNRHPRRPREDSGGGDIRFRQDPPAQRPRDGGSDAGRSYDPLDGRDGRTTRGDDRRR